MASFLSLKLATLPNQPLVSSNKLSSAIVGRYPHLLGPFLVVWEVLVVDPGSPIQDDGMAADALLCFRRTTYIWGVLLALHYVRGSGTFLAGKK